MSVSDHSYESANRSKTMPDDEQALCLIYINAVKDLGEQIANRIELKFDADSTADQSMTKTIELLSHTEVTHFVTKVVTQRLVCICTSILHTSYKHITHQLLVCSWCVTCV